MSQRCYGGAYFDFKHRLSEHSREGRASKVPVTSSGLREPGIPRVELQADVFPSREPQIGNFLHAKITQMSNVSCFLEL